MTMTGGQSQSHTSGGVADERTDVCVGVLHFFSFLQKVEFQIRRISAVVIITAAVVVVVVAN